jgi:DNA-binding SARP family transcriptional activator
VTTLDRPPHYARVRALLAALDAPVVQLWGWPGTGKRAILQGLLEDEPDAEYLPTAWLEAPQRLEERLRRLIGRRPALLVGADGGAVEGLELAAALLRPGQRLLVADERRIELPRESLATPPDSLLLRADEVRRLWRGAVGRELTAGEADRLLARSDGWLHPLALWSRDPALAGGELDDERALFAPLAGFLRERVLDALDTDERQLLDELAARAPVSWEAFTAEDERARESVLRGMIDRLGLPRQVDGRLSLPAPLSALLAGEARARRPRFEGASPALAAAVESERREHQDASPDVRVVMLGVPRVERRDPSGRMVPVTWSFKRPLRILAYLASAPDLQATREEIVSILWPEASEEAIRRNLHPAVSWLRRSVWPGRGQGGVVLLRDGVYSLDPALRWEVDVRTFLERIEAGARHLARNRAEEAQASWEAAWRLYQGAFLQGWSDRWILAQREELQVRFIDLLRRLGDLETRLGRLTEAEDAYRTLLLEDPLEEGVHVSIMRIYAARGRRDLVNRQFQRLRDVLRSELGVDPSPPTLDVFNEIMIADARARR